MDLADRIIIIDRSDVAYPPGSPLRLAIEVYNPTNVPRQITVLGLSIIKTAATSTNYYYVVGYDESNNPLLIRVNPADDTTTILQSVEYDIFKLNASEDDEVIFNALRMTDGKMVIGKIDAAGTTTIIDETLDQEVTVLERIK